MTPLPNWEALPLAKQVAQMVVVRASGHLFDHQIEYPDWEPPASVLQHWLQDLGVGGVILLGGTAAEVGLRTQQLQAWAKVPLLIAADIEEGVGQRFAGATWFPPPMALAAIAQTNLEQALTYAEQMGAVTAKEAIAIGINWVLAPVVDVNNNPENPVINIRAWGETAEIVSQLTTAFIRGAQRYPVLTTAKHFPGHGDTAIDSHLELPIIAHDRIRLAAVEWVPFQAAIRAGVDAVMTAHVKIPALDANHPATLSKPILMLLRELGFTGLTVTDALMMGAITQSYGANEAAVLAVEAGVDLLLMPVDPEGAIQAVCEAVEAGRIAKSRIHAALDRIWQAKQKVGAQLSSPIQMHQLAQPDALATSHAILKAALQWHDPPIIQPDLTQPDVTQPNVTQPNLTQPGQSRNLIVVDDALNCPFLNRQAPAITFPQALGYRLQIVDSYTPQINWDATQPNQIKPEPTLLQVFVRGNPFRSSANLIQSAEQILQFLLSTGQLQALIVYGSPYGMARLQALVVAEATDVPYVFTHGQLAAAQTVALETLLSRMQSGMQLSHSSQYTNPRTFTD